MPGWIIAAAIGSIALTALLTFVLWRMNAPMLERHKNGDGGDGGGYAPGHDGSRHDASDASDGGGD
jgi:hypothetical protein